MLKFDPRSIFEQGKLLALPTETVYGLAAPIDRPDLIEKIFTLKNRPKNDPLITHCSSIEMVEEYFEITNEIRSFLEKFWPGPLTVILPRPQSISPVVTAGLETAAVRIPQHKLAKEIIERYGKPLVAPSANPFTQLSPTSIKHVSHYFQDEDVFMVDGGECTKGLESTIVFIYPENKQLQILRPGPIKVSSILEYLKNYTVIEGKPIVSTPGQMNKHYRPIVPVIICSEVHYNQKAYQTSSFFNPEFSTLILNSDFSSIEQFLYKELYQRSQNYKCIIVVVSKDNWDGPNFNAIRNRLQKAASDQYLD